LEEVSDPEALEPLKHELGQPQGYHWSEIEALARVLYKSAYTQRAADHAQIERHLQPAVDRFKDLPEDEQQEIELRQASRLRQPMIIAIGHIAPFPADWWGRGGDRRAGVDSDHLAGEERADAAPTSRPDCTIGAARVIGNTR
jgi:hypothetical protein